MARKFVEGADLFVGPYDSFDAAQAAIEEFKSGEKTEFMPVHGKIAGYHIDPREKHVPIQEFPDGFGEGMPVTVTFLKRVGDISITRPGGLGGVPRFFPRIRATVEYGPELEPAGEAATTGADEPAASAEASAPAKSATEAEWPEGPQTEPDA
jgi:hypothetical protein